MGATLEFTRLEAKDYRTAIVILQEGFYTTDPYSGDFNTCDEFYDYSKRFSDVTEFSDWVEEDGEKRVAYFYKYDDGRWLVGGWCAC
jgi:hypothetical protein